MTKPTGRRLAQLVLDQIELRASYANLALQNVLGEYRDIDRRERAFCTELVYGTLRHLLKIDFILGRLLSRPLASLKTTVKNVLRLALYQLIYLPEIPRHAVCHSAVEQMKNSKFSGLAPLVNGVLRNYLRNEGQLALPDREADPAGYLAIEYSHPLWLVKRWLDFFGISVTEQILAADNQQPPLTVRVNQHSATIPAVLAELTREGVECNPGLFLSEALTIGSLPGAVEELTVFKAGQVFVQDESSMLVAHLLKPAPGELIIDLCAAPGGKSTHLAEIMGDRGAVFSIDDHRHKINLIAENAGRLKLGCVKPVFGDARNFQLPGNKAADAVLVDVPCSGTGVLRRRVDLRYRRQPEEILQLVETQREILNHAASLVRPGGRLVYSTCTLEKEENEAQIEWFLATHPEYQAVDFRAFLPANLEPYLAEPARKWAAILPIPGGGDGFFMCRMEKTGPLPLG
jgi:16S rRNA (cytosine967-C5)-methyltransferase